MRPTVGVALALLCGVLAAVLVTLVIIIVMDPG